MNGRWILQDLNYTFNVIVVCVLNCKYPQFNSAQLTHSHSYKEKLFCDIFMMEIFLHFIILHLRKKRRRAGKFITILWVEKNFMRNLTAGASGSVSLFVCIFTTQRDEITKWKITHIDELYHQTCPFFLPFSSSIRA